MQVRFLPGAQGTLQKKCFLFFIDNAGSLPAGRRGFLPGAQTKTPQLRSFVLKYGYEFTNPFGGDKSY